MKYSPSFEQPAEQLNINGWLSQDFIFLFCGRTLHTIGINQLNYYSLDTALIYTKIVLF